MINFSLPNYSKVLISLFCFSFGLLAIAQSAVLIDPPSQLFETSAGDSLDQAITVVNPAQSRVRIRAYLSDWNYDPSGKPNYVEQNTLPRSASNWITFNPSELVLEPEEKGTIRYTIDVPSDVDTGTHWSVLFFEGESTEALDENAIANFSVRVGHLIYVSVAPLNKIGNIAGILGKPPEIPSNPYQLAVQYFNGGNAAQGVEGTFELRDSSGEPVLSKLIERHVVLPESLRVFVVNLYGPLPVGDYTALFIFNYGDESIDVAGDYSFRLETALENFQQQELETEELETEELETEELETEKEIAE